LLHTAGRVASKSAAATSPPPSPSNPKALFGPPVASSCCTPKRQSRFPCPWRPAAASRQPMRCRAAGGRNRPSTEKCKNARTLHLLQPSPKTMPDSVGAGAAIEYPMPDHPGSTCCAFRNSIYILPASAREVVFLFYFGWALRPRVSRDDRMARNGMSLVDELDQNIPHIRGGKGHQTHRAEVLASPVVWATLVASVCCTISVPGFTLLPL